MWQTPFYRIYQQTMRLAEYFLGIKEPKTLTGEGSLKKAPIILKEKGLSKPLVVTDNGIHSLGLLNPLFDALKAENVEFAYFHDVVANPTIKNVEDGLKIYKENNCDSIIAVGGGSAMDAAKMIGARAVRPKKSVEKNERYFESRKSFAFLDCHSNNCWHRK